MSHWGHIAEELEANARAGRDQMESQVAELALYALGPAPRYGQTAARHLIYTAITRATRLVVLVVEGAGPPAASRSAMPRRDRDRAFDRIDRARELDQGTVAGQLGHAAAVVRDRRLDELLAMGPGARMRIGLARL